MRSAVCLVCLPAPDLAERLARFLAYESHHIGNIDLFGFRSLSDAPYIVWLHGDISVEKSPCSRHNL